VLVRDDQERTGGVLVLQSAALDVVSAAKVFDTWVERCKGLPTLFDEAG